MRMASRARVCRDWSRCSHLIYKFRHTVSPRAPLILRSRFLGILTFHSRLVRSLAIQYNHRAKLCNEQVIVYGKVHDDVIFTCGSRAAASSREMEAAQVGYCPTDDVQHDACSMHVVCESYYSVFTSNHAVTRKVGVCDIFSPPLDTLITQLFHHHPFILWEQCDEEDANHTREFSADS